jgi:hypothetical protein
LNKGSSLAAALVATKFLTVVISNLVTFCCAGQALRSLPEWTILTVSYMAISFVGQAN